MAKYIVVHGIRIATEFVPKTFGRLTTLGPNFILPVGKKAKPCSFCVCVCNCREDSYVVSRVDDLRNGRILSCGCLRDETIRKRATRHGLSDTDEFKIWLGIEQRCNNPNRRGYENYGGKGVQICMDWSSKLHPKGVAFQNFIEHVGPRPSKEHSIDRHPNKNGNYEPGNVRWATHIEQANNKSSNHMIEFRGECKTVANWARELNIESSLIYARLGMGWSIEDIVNTPSAKGLHRNSIVYQGEKISWEELAKRHGIRSDTLRYRMKQGWSLEKALTTPVKKRRISH